MQFSAKFFIISLILAFVSQMPSVIAFWWMTSNVYPESFQRYQIILYAIYLPLDVLLPFAVMFILSEKTSSKSTLRTAMMSTFLGCWVGAASGLVLQQVIPFIRGQNLTYMWTLVTWVGWSVLSGAFSYTFFVSLSAILFAFYKNTRDQAVPSAPPQPP